jgi:hypothetical protein
MDEVPCACSLNVQYACLAVQSRVGLAAWVLMLCVQGSLHICGYSSVGQNTLP